MRGHALPAAVLAGALAIFFAPAASPSRQFLYRDAGRMHAPMKRHVAARWAEGSLPQWNPYAGLGTPLVAGAVDAVQHPFNLLLVALPFQAGFKLWVILSYALAAGGAYAWARALGRSRAAATFAGLAFALSGFLVSSSDNLTYLTTLAAVPWILSAAHAHAARGGPGRLALLGAAAALVAAGGDPQGAALALALAPAYAVAVAVRGGGLALALRRCAAQAATAAAFAAPFLLPVAAWIVESSRGAPLDAADQARWNLHPLRLAELLFPGLFATDLRAADTGVFETYAGNAFTPDPWVLSIYAGAGVLALALLGASRSRGARALLLAAAVLTWMAMGPHAGFGALARLLPVLGSLRYWEKLFGFATLALALAAAHGVDALPDERARRRLGMILGAVAAAALLLAGVALLAGDAAAVLVARPGAPAGAAPALVANGRAGALHLAAACGVLALALLWRSPLAALAAAAVALVDLAAGSARAYVLSPSRLAEPGAPIAAALRQRPGLQRIVQPFRLLPRGGAGVLAPFEATFLLGARTLAAAWNVPERVGNLEAYAGMPPARADRYRRRAATPDRIPGVGLWGVGFVVVPWDRALLAPTGLAGPYTAAAEDSTLPAWLVPIPHRERAYVATDVVPIDRRGAMEFVLDPGSVGSGRTVVEGPVPEGLSGGGGEARIVVDEPERVEVEASARGPALLVLNDVLASGWSAELDGRPAEIVPANYLARGVFIGAGTHRVAFRYRTPLLREGWAIALAAAFAVAGVAAVTRLRPRGAP